jgi:predicted TIM-barrel fold metal-dependent hydrolase
MLPFRLDPFRLMLSKKRPIMDSMTAFVCHGVFSRFPRLRVAAIENGSDWVIPLLHDLADVYRKMPQELAEDPVEAFTRCVWISPFHEDDIGALIDAIGADHVLFGSDFPHPEGLAQPCSYVDHLPPGLDGDVVARIMGGNLAEIMRVPVPAEVS